MKVKLKFSNAKDHELFEIHQLWKILKVSRGQKGIGYVIVEIPEDNEAEEIVTSKGFKFKKVGSGIFQDLSTGLIWGPKEEGRYNHYEALSKFGDKLPTKEQFEVAEAHGIREVLVDMESYWFWSSAVHPNLSDYALGFSGYYGNTGYFYRGLDYGSVRCVAGRG